MRRTSLYITLVVAAASAAGVIIYRLQPRSDPHSTVAVLLLSLLALVAEMLAYLLPRSATGSISFIPFLACVILVPLWPTLFAAATVRFVVELLSKRRAYKSIFNIAQYALTVGVGIIVFRLLGPKDILTHSKVSLSQLTLVAGAPALAAFTAALFVNWVTVSFAIALSTGTPVKKIWIDNNFASIGLDLAAAPLIFVFAWVYLSAGPMAAAALWVPVLGLRQVYKTNLELERTNHELLQLMVKSIEARDPYTSGHSRRVQHHSTIIARAIGLNEREIDKIGRAALLHDVGKIYEKYAPILRKADKLTPEEWTTMQEHPIDGAKLVATMSGLQDLVPAVRHHHENWDGSGYPDGLVGEAIPLASRIITFGDTIDAMTSERPYRRPLGEPQVRAEIRRCRGKQFDPEIADKLLASSAWLLLFEPPTRPETQRYGLVLVDDVLQAEQKRVV